MLLDNFTFKQQMIADFGADGFASCGNDAIIILWKVCICIYTCFIITSSNSSETEYIAQYDSLSVQFNFMCLST